MIFMRKRLLSILLCLVMVTGLLPTALAVDEEGGDSADEPTTGSVIYVDAVSGNDDSENVGESWETAYQTLKTAVAAAKSGDTIMLSAAKYTLYGIPSTNTTTGKDLTFIGQGADKTGWNIGAEVPNPANFGTEYNGDYSFDGAGTITFKNMTLQSGNADYLGFIRANNTVVENCTLEGRTAYWGYESATFTNCTFKCPTVDYAIWTYSSPEMTFDHCTFNSHGKIVKVYTDNPQINITVNFQNCTVNNTLNETTKKYKQVLAIDDSRMGKGYNFTLNIKGNNEVTGVTPDGITCSRLFGFDNEKSENAGHTIVNIEGTTVWKKGERTVDHNHDFTTGSYNNGVATDNANKYTDGYKDDAFTTTYGSWEWDRDENKLARTVTKTCNYCSEKVKTTEYKDLELDVSRSKTATALDSSDQSTVTLSLPSAEETLVSDVVFVLDESDCNEAVLTEMTDLLSGLRETAQANNASINVGVIFFRGIAVTAYPLTKYTGNNEPILKAISDANSQMTMKGTNLPAGLQAAESMLSTSNTSATRQYMILVSDGATYLYTHDNDPTTHYSRTSGYYSMDGGLYEWQAKYDPDIYGKNSIPYALPKDFSHNGNATDWENFLNEIASKRETFVSFDQEYVRTKDKAVADLTKPDPIYTGDTIKDFVTNVEESFYQSATAYQQIVKSGVNCYSIAVNDNMGVFTTFANYLAELGKGSGMNFDSIKNDILYAVGEGSVVEDKMGADFDFVPGSLKLTVNKEPLDSKVDGNTTYFGAKDTAKEIGSDNYRFKVEYDSSNDEFTWTINENVSNFAPVQLSYQVKLVNRSTTAGTHSVPTNEYATLTPKNSAGWVGKVLEFNKPVVSYTVKNSSGGGGGGGNSKPVVIPDKVPTGLNGDDHYAYIVGYPDSTVHPQNGITRAEVATIFFRLLTDEVRNKNSTKTNSYSDVASTDWYNHAVSTLSAMDIIKGDTHGKFNPNAPITRAEFAAIAARFDDKANTTTADFSDIASHWAKDEISAAANNGWINGYTDGTFRPNNNITRAEAMTLVNRVLKRLPETAEDLHDDMIKWTDNSDTSKWYYLAVQEATNSHYYETKNTQYEKWTKLRETRDWIELEK